MSSRSYCSSHDSRRSRSRYDPDNRVKRRHEIMEKGVPSVWGRSPEPERAESRSHSHRSKDRNSSPQDRHRSSYDDQKKYKSDREHSREHHSRGRHHEDRHKSSSRHDDKLKSSGDPKMHKHKQKRSSRRSSSPSSRSSSSSASSPIRNEHSSEVKIEAEIVKTEKKPTSYIELLSKREEEEFMNQLKKKQEQNKKNKTGESGQQHDPSSALNSRDFGKALLPGEGAAMAAFVAGGKRIPRRGEIGLTSDEIEKFENQGYVMSGSRHRRMEAVRLRKEGQIYSAEEKRVLADLDREERAKKNQKLQSYFTQIIEAKQPSTSGKPSGDAT